MQCLEPAGYIIRGVVVQSGISRTIEKLPEYVDPDLIMQVGTISEISFVKNVLFVNRLAMVLIQPFWFWSATFVLNARLLT